MTVSVSNITQQPTAVVPVAKLPEVERTVPRAAAQPVHDTVTLTGQMPQKVVYGDPRLGRNKPKQAADTELEAEPSNDEAQPAAKPKK